MTARPNPAARVPVVQLTADAGFERLSGTEWLLTNGFGGFAMGTPSGIPTRRYHGMLVSDSRTSPMRRVYLNACAEEVVLTSGGTTRVVALSSFRFRAGDGADVVHPEGWASLTSFEKGAGCRWEFDVPGVKVVKRLALRRDTRAAVLHYDVTPSKGVQAELRVRPLVSLRNFHWTPRRQDGDRRFDVLAGESGCEVRRVGEDVRLFLAGGGDGAGACSFAHDEQWWYNFLYSVDRARGQECIEDTFSPGEFVFRASGRRVKFGGTIQASLDSVPVAGIDEVEEAIAAHRSRLVAHAAKAAGSAKGPELASLVWASDDFVIAPNRPGEEKGIVSVIAGYPWFADWGRDAMISLPGLLLLTGRHDEAKRVLLRFARATRRGIVPNRFGDDEGEPQYNTVDASLWFVQACWRYARATGDTKGFTGELLPTCLEILEHYRRGTDYSIGMDPHDFLVSAGSALTQLTWMDAQRDGVVFTPRHGKAVEINALWCSGLALMAEATQGLDRMRSADLRSLAEAAASSFRSRFWNTARSCCYDSLAPAGGGWTPSAEVRPNQVFAASLPESPLTPSQRRDVVACVQSLLYTPMGLRTLAPGEAGYRPRFRGDLYALDSAYHNGTAWPWLLGALAEAVMRLDGFSAISREEARKLLRPIISYLDGWCLGQLPEVFDAEGTPDDPQRPGGCPAQAWSVAEVLRSWGMSLGASESL
jgi:predicted glycogen debranching enzyme